MNSVCKKMARVLKDLMYTPEKFSYLLEILAKMFLLVRNAFKTDFFQQNAWKTHIVYMFSSATISRVFPICTYCIKSH